MFLRFSRLPALAVLIAATAAWAEAPRTIALQARLASPSGAPVPNGAYTVTLRLYDSATGGQPLHTEIETVSTSAGVFAAVLGEPGGLPPAVKFDAPYFVGVSVGADPEMTPRLPLRSVPYALALPGLRTERTASTPNIIGGLPENSVSATVRGATISGGGSSPVAGLANGPNRVTDDYGTVVGGSGNQAGRDNADVADASYATVVGGLGNKAQATYSTVGGGQVNEAFGPWSTIAGGDFNFAYGIESTVGGGFNNIATGDHAFIGGGYGNLATGAYAAIAGGGRSVRTDVETGNRVTDDYGSVGGGGNNRAGNSDEAGSNAPYATVGGGLGNTAGGPYSTVPGGRDNSALGDHSMAAGRRARANHAGSFVWGDATDADVTSTGANQFVARASGGVTFYSNNALTMGVTLPAGGGAFAPVSDRALKTNVAPVNGLDVLERLAAMPVHTWSYRSQHPSIRHIGPMAQDFAAAFGVGEDNRHISTIDADGVALAAIQGLHQRLREKDAQIAALQQQLNAVMRRLDRLETGR